MKKILKNKKMVTSIFSVIIVLLLFATQSETVQKDLIKTWLENIEITTNYETGSEIETVPLAETSGIIVVTLERVVDGDTIVVNHSGEQLKIRLIGIDTPESVSPKKEKNNIYGTYASEYTKEVLENAGTLYLEYDEEETDSFDRILAYVWMDDDFATYENMLNYKIVQDGYGINKEYPPNLKYAEALESACIYAKENEKGLWIYEEYKNLVD